MTTQQYVSIFEALEQDLGDKLDTIMLTKATLIHLSHTLEDFVLQRELPALIFTGFQESSHWRQEAKRYQQLSEVAMQVCIFAGQPLPEDEPVSALQIELKGEDPLRQEWFLAILSTDFTVILAGLDNMEEVEAESFRRFRTIWSFDVDTVKKVLDSLEKVIKNYRPEALPQLQEARRSYPAIDPKSDIVIKFTNELLKFEDQLQRELGEKNAQIRKQEAQYRMLIEESPIGLISLDGEGRVSVLEENKHRPLFKPRNIYVGMTIDDIDDTLPELVTHYYSRLNGKDPASLLEVDEGIFELRSQLIPATTQQQTSMLIVFVDITERYHIEQHRKKQEQRLLLLQKEKEMNDLRAQIMITLSHEIRTPLASIQSSSDLLLSYYDRLSPEKRKSRLENIQVQVEQLKQIMEDINAVVRQEHIPLGDDLQPIDVDAVVSEAIESVRLATQRDVDCYFNLKSERLLFDSRTVRYIITNLLTNAIKYSDEDSPVILEVVEHDNTIEIIVTDSGIGIPEEELSNITQPFYRGSNIGMIGGTGLGLSIIQSGVQAMNGSMKIRSTVQVGTTITITLPTRNDNPAVDTS